MYSNLREFVSALERAGELKRISVPVDPVLEIAEIADRVSKSPAPHLPSASAVADDPGHFAAGGSALLFENVEGSPWPVLINAFGSYRRTEIALGCNEGGFGIAPGRVPGGFEALAAKIRDLVKPELPGSIAEAAALLKRFAPLRKIPPRSVRSGPCQQIVLTGDSVDLRALPIIRCWPLDGDAEAVGYPAGVNDGIAGVDSGQAWDAKYRGRYITLAGVLTIHADDAGRSKPRSQNVGMYRVQLLSKRLMAMHWHVHHDGAAHWRSWKQRGERMPVAIVLGGPAVLPYAATAPLPPGVSELLMAGFLQGAGVRMTRAVTVPMRVPADAEIVIEGYVSHDAGPMGYDPRTDGPLGPGAVFEGPFGDHTGFYSMPDRYPLLEVTAITHRRDPIYPTTIVGLPPQEDYYLGKATERMFLPLLRTLVPDIEDYDLPMFGAFHNCAFITIRKQYALQARRVMHAIWGAGQMAWTKTIFVVDQDVDVHDAASVLSACARWCDPARDIETVRGPLDILDHAAPWLGAGTKIGFDSTRKWPGEQIRASEPTTARSVSRADRERWTVATARIEGVDAAWAPEEFGGWLFVIASGHGRPIAERLAEQSDSAPFVVVVGPGVKRGDTEGALFHWGACCDPGRDRLPGPAGVVFDATTKAAGQVINGLPVRPWPPIIEMDTPTRDKVSRRWSEYGLA